MATCTFFLKGRNKTYTANSILECYEQFMDNYGEVAKEVFRVEVDCDGQTLEHTGQTFMHVCKRVQAEEEHKRKVGKRGIH